MANPQLWSFVGAWLFGIIAHRYSLGILLKNKAQRSKVEAQKVASGLWRTECLEFLLSMPASTVLMLLLLPLVVDWVPWLQGLRQSQPRAFFVGVGVLGYQFPYNAIRQQLLRATKETLEVWISHSIRRSKVSQTRPPLHNRRQTRRVKKD